MASIVSLLKGFLRYLLYMIPGFIAIGIVIYIHEIGHFIAARLMHVDVEVLGYGFGPTIWSYQGKKTEFRISLIPFGGYCRMKGADDLQLALQENEDHIKYTEAGSFFSISPLKKFFIYFAGPFTNLLLGFLLLAIVAAVPVERISDPALVTPISAYPEFFQADIQQKELQKGDLLLSAGKKEFKDYQDFTAYLSSHAGETLVLRILRNGKEERISISPTLYNDNWSYGISNLQETVIGRSESPDFIVGDRIIEANGTPVVYTLDIYSLNADAYDFVIVRNGERRLVHLKGNCFPFAWHSNLRVSPDSEHPFVKAWERTTSLIKSTVTALAKLLTFHLNEALAVISGPFTSATTFTKISTLALKTSNGSGLRTILYLLSVVSISICIGNLIPIPTFDGGQLLVSIFEGIRRKPLHTKSYMILHIGGLIAAYGIILLMNSWHYISQFLG